MYKIYKTSQNKLLNPAKPGKNFWLNIKSPTPEEMEMIQKITGIPMEDLEDILVSVKDKEEVPKIEEAEKGYRFILLQTPLDYEKNDDEEANYGIAPLGIIFNKDHIITITEGKNDVIDYITGKLKNFQANQIIDTAQPQRIILKLFLFTAKIYLRYLKQIYIHINSAQAKMEKSPQNKDILNLMDVGKSLAYFSRSLIANQSVLQKLGKRRLFVANEIDEELIEDTLDEYKQAKDTVKIYDRIVTNTTNTLANIINNNVNRTVKFLTSLTFILTLPALVANVYGMNVALPLQDEPHAFAIVIAISLAFSIIGVIWFYRNRLF